MRLIDADDLKSYKCSICDNRGVCEDRETVCSDIAEIDEQPTIEAEPVKHGRWVGGYCSECCEHAPYWSMASTYYESKYCPNCGARMDGGVDNE